jgi:acyl-CoA synthetase (AMP-forming)/AMP-acid ligase II
VFAGYLGDDAATDAAMSGPWLRSGDLVHRDSSGVIRIVDRLKDIYISGGENVAPAEVEFALCLHPLISAAAVVGVPFSLVDRMLPLVRQALAAVEGGSLAADPWLGGDLPETAEDLARKISESVRAKLVPLLEEAMIDLDL